MKKRIIFIVILIIVSFLQLTAKEKLHLKVGTYENPPKIVTAENGKVSGFWADISGKDFGRVEKIAIIPFWLEINLVIMLVLEITIFIYYRLLRNQVNKKTIELQRNITKRRKTEDALRESEVRYRTLFNSSKDAIMTLEPPTWKFSAGNPAILDMFGVKDESEFTSFAPWELSPEKQPDGRLSSEKAKEMIRIALKKGYNFFEWTHKRLNGEEFPATVLLARIKIYDKTFLQATVKDITEQKKSERIQKILYKITDAVNTTKDLNEFFEIVHKQLNSVIDTTNFYIAFYDKDQDSISFDYYIDEFADKKENINVARKPKKGLTEYVIRTGKSLLADHEVIEKLTKAGKIDEIGTPSKIWLGVPLKIENEVISMICVQSYTDVSLYTEKDIEILEFVSDTISIAIERKKAETTRKKAETIQKMLYNIADAVNTTKDLNEFYKIIHEQLSSVIDTTNYYVALYDKETDTISLPYHTNTKDKITSFPAGKTLTSYVIKTGKSLLVDKEVDEKLTKAGKIETVGAPSKIWLGVPLKIENEIMGMICVQSYTDASLYTEKDIEILEFVSDEIAITIERKQAEEKLKESEEKYRLIVENANDGIEITQEDEIIFANRQFAEILGYKLDELKDIPFSQFFTEEAISDLNDRHEKREAGMVVPHQHETTFKKKDGTVIDVYIKYEIIDYKQEPATFAIISDITDRKKAEEKLAQYRDHLEKLVKKRTKKLKQTQAQLVRKEKLTVLGQLAGSIGHDLRNPLGVISNSVFYLNMKLKDKDEKVKKHLALLKKEIERSDNMLSDLLDFSRVKLLNITETNVNTLIKETIEETKIPEYIDLEMDLDEKIPQIPLDPDKMQRVFQNMIFNAIQAMSEKGKLHIKTSSNDDFTEISFSDNGQGIIKENLKKIFEPLVTTRAKGIGLGLAIVKNIIDSHKGKIDVKSEVGKGTTFTIKLRN
jgi:PAS domain S-box-containing protein